MPVESLQDALISKLYTSKESLMQLQEDQEKQNLGGSIVRYLITVSRIQAGVNFYFENEKILLRAQNTYGIPAEIICAIIGVETLFGKNMGSWKVLDALYTLGV